MIFAMIFAHFRNCLCNRHTIPSWNCPSVWLLIDMQLLELHGLQYLGCLRLLNSWMFFNEHNLPNTVFQNL